jgi:nucleoside-diphosphate-sugar epimerase
MRLVCDSAKLRRRTGWQPRHTLNDGLKHTIDWFLDPGNLNRYRPGSYTV